MRIVHLARDEKFIPLLRELFEAAHPGANRWLVARRSRAALKFVKPGADVTDRAEWWWRTPLLRGDVADADVLIAHSMTTIFANALRHAPQARAVWLGWGYDYYPLLAEQLGPPLLPLTRALVRGDDDEPAVKRLALADAAARLHTFCVLPPEVPLLRRALPKLTAVHCELPLFTREDVFERGPSQMQGADVLLGNSATASNNHLDAFELFKTHPLPGRLIVPLSYGNLDYGAQVAVRGAAQFGGRFDGLRDFMTLDDYNRRIAGCGFVVMNHCRQQAVGNIGAALFKGATVYLRRENPLFAFYRDLGIHLRCVDDLADGAALTAIDSEQRAANRERIGAYYARERVVRAIRELPALQS
jgi:dTDP-N-acetylfucosamine:lipid II N-acetylfucosaminyltransferase